MPSDELLTVIIGTIDSFMYSLSSKEIIGQNYFYELVNSVRKGNMDISQKGSINYAKQSLLLNKNTIVIVDEAQDLQPYYAEAILTIMRETSIDVYVIGDKLQSISYQNNVMTHLMEQQHYNLK